jgi:hypothetical protein
MGQEITLKIESLVLTARLNDSDSARALAAALPMEIGMSRWGDEYYGGCGLRLPEAEDARELMEVGELAYWSPGSAFCIFFGPTPASSGAEPRAASAVNPLGRILDDCSGLKALGASVRARLEEAG